MIPLPFQIFRNPSVGLLYEHACKYEKGSIIASNGSLVAYSGEKRGRCPLDKRVVDEPSTSDVCNLNKKMNSSSHDKNHS